MLGNLFIPANNKVGKQYPAIIMVCLATGIKEQVDGTYAERLTERGFIALAFDNAPGPKELIWVDGATLFSLSHNEEQIIDVSDKLNTFYKEELK